MQYNTFDKTLACSVSHFTQNLFVTSIMQKYTSRASGLDTP